MAVDIALTGATGYIGREIIRQSLKSGLSLIAVSRNPSRSSPSVVQYPVDFLTGDGLEAAFAGARVVIHAAGVAHRHSGATAAEYTSGNETSTLTALHAAASAGVERFVLLSSVAVYGGSSHGRAISESVQCTPNSSYARSKLAAEVAVSTAANSLGVEAIILRLCTVYGSEDPGNVRHLVRAISNRDLLPVSTHTRKSLIHRSDAARACLLAALAPGSAVTTYNVVGGVYDAVEITRCIATRLAVDVREIVVPRALADATCSLADSLPFLRAYSSKLRRWLSDEAYDGRAFATDFGFAPSMTLEDGIGEEVEWYSSFRHARR